MPQHMPACKDGGVEEEEFQDTRIDSIPKYWGGCVGTILTLWLGPNAHFAGVGRRID